MTMEIDWFAKEKCIVCGEEFDSIMIQHPPLDEKHKEQLKILSEKRKAELEIRQANRKPWNELENPYARFISKECPDLETAKVFVSKWYRGVHEFSIDNQNISIPEVGELQGSCRAMARFVSSILEGYDDDYGYDYLRTEYGPILYSCM